MSKENGTSLKSWKPVRIGLTGSIGMGKSTITKQFRRLGIPVFDADEAVHNLYSKHGKAVEPIREIYPNVIVEDSVNRMELMKLILSDSTVLPTIERIVHPLVIAQRHEFTERCSEAEQLFVVYDIPLLFEKFSEYSGVIDYIIVASCDFKTQEERVLRRPNMTKVKFQSILSKQLPDEYKREHADYVIYTNYSSYVEGKAQLSSVLEDIIVRKESERFNFWKMRTPFITKQYGDKEPRELLQLFDVVIFDLDETLCPIIPPLQNAMSSLIASMKETMPKTYTSFCSPSSFDEIIFSEALKSEMLRIKKENPLIRHDLTEVRRRAMVHIGREFGEDENVDFCMQAFLTSRSNISPYLYDDSIPCLKFLNAAGIKASILTNGNCHLLPSTSPSKETKENEIVHYLEDVLSASDIGCSKPQIVAFLSAIQRLNNIPPSRILYVGDDYENDVLGAAAAGMKTAFIVRNPVQYEAILADEGHKYNPKQKSINKIDYLINNLHPPHLVDRVFNGR